MSGTNIRQIISDFSVLAAAGQIRGVETKAQVGFNDSVGSTIEDIWPPGGLLIYLTNAENMDVSSTSTDDTLLGTGAQTVLIKGLDFEFLEIEEELNLNGTTVVTTINKFIRIESCRVIAAGIGGENAGDISLISNLSATLQCFVAISFNNDQQVQYTVPANKFAVITQFLMETQKDQQAFINVWIRPPDEVFFLGRNWNVYQSSLVTPLNPPLAIGPKTDITMRGLKITASDIQIACNINFYLVDISNLFT